MNMQALVPFSGRRTLAGSMRQFINLLDLTDRETVKSDISGEIYTDDDIEETLHYLGEAERRDLLSDQEHRSIHFYTYRIGPDRLYDDSATYSSPLQLYLSRILPISEDEGERHTRHSGFSVFARVTHDPGYITLNFALVLYMLSSGKLRRACYTFKKFAFRVFTASLFPVPQPTSDLLLLDSPVATDTEMFPQPYSLFNGLAFPSSPAFIEFREEHPSPPPVIIDDFDQSGPLEIQPLAPPQPSPDPPAPILPPSDVLEDAVVASVAPKLVERTRNLFNVHQAASQTLAQSGFLAIQALDDERKILRKERSLRLSPSCRFAVQDVNALGKAKKKEPVARPIDMKLNTLLNKRSADLVLYNAAATCVYCEYTIGQACINQDVKKRPIGFFRFDFKRGVFYTHRK